MPFKYIKHTVGFDALRMFTVTEYRSPPAQNTMADTVSSSLSVQSDS